MKTIITILTILILTASAYAESKPTVYVLKNDTIRCGTKKKAIEVFNRIRGRGGNYTNRSVKRMGCTCVGWLSKALIVGSDKDSSFVKMRYYLPQSDVEVQGWFYKGQIVTFDEYKKGRLR